MAVLSPTSSIVSAHPYSAAHVDRVIRWLPSHSSNMSFFRSTCAACSLDSPPANWKSQQSVRIAWEITQHVKPWKREGTSLSLSLSRLSNPWSTQHRWQTENQYTLNGRYIFEWTMLLLPSQFARVYHSISTNVFFSPILGWPGTVWKGVSLENKRKQAQN